MTDITFEPHSTKVVSVSGDQDMSWMKSALAQLGLNTIHHTIEDENNGVDLWKSIPLLYVQYPGVIIFLCHDAKLLDGNDYWFSQRKGSSGKSVIIDRHGHRTHPH